MPKSKQTVTLVVSRERNGEWCIEIPERDGTEFAKVFGSSLGQVLQLALPYLTCVVDDSLWDATYKARVVAPDVLAIRESADA